MLNVKEFPEISTDVRTSLENNTEWIILGLYMNPIEACLTTMLIQSPCEFTLESEKDNAQEKFFLCLTLLVGLILCLFS